MSESHIKLIVNLKDRSYPIFIGHHLLTPDLFHPYIGGQQVFIVTNETIAPLYLEKLRNCFPSYQCDFILLPDGEEYKNLISLSAIFDSLIKNKHRRNTTLISLGGGVIGDLTGFAAACYQRGVPFIQVPTSLLGQVDASVGGKTAVNHPLAKNMIGAFHQPKAVFIDISTLKTLPPREFHSGLAEVVKAALILNKDFFYWLETHIDKILMHERAAMLYAIEQACAIKVKIVVADERENNQRALLNLGHTFAHAIEQSLGYGSWLHGEAVAVGLVLAADVSMRLGFLKENELSRIKKILTIAQLPIRLPNSITADGLIESMSTDKKKTTEQLRFVLLKGIGQAVIRQDINLKILEEAIAENRD